MLDRKGFAITSILYGIMLLFLMVLLALLATLRLQDDNLERSVNRNNNFCGIYYLKQGDSISLFPNFSVVSNEDINITDKKIDCNL